MGRNKAGEKKVITERDARVDAYLEYCKSVNRKPPIANQYPAYVYFIDNQMGYIKIGWSKNYKQRLQILQTASPFRLTVWALLGCNDPDEAKRIERYLHVLFDEDRTLNEWFEFTPELYQTAVKFLNGEIYPDLECEHIAPEED